MLKRRIVFICIISCLCLFGALVNAKDVTDEDAVIVDTVGEWSLEQTVDEFGDPTGDECVRTYVVGDFSNTATTSSELKVYMYYMIDSHSFSFRLLEYGRTKAVYFDEDEITLKIKIDDNIFDYTLTGKAPNGDLSLSFEDQPYSYSQIWNCLLCGDDLRCIIYIGSSKYNFTISSNGFSEITEPYNKAIYDNAMELFEEEDYYAAYDQFRLIGDYADSTNKMEECKKRQEQIDIIDTPEEAVYEFFDRDSQNERYHYMMDHMEDFLLQTDDDLKEILPGEWLRMDMTERGYADWVYYKYDEANQYQYGIFQNINGNVTYKDTSESAFCHEYWIENNKVYYDSSYPYKSLEFRKILDGYYLTIGYDEADAVVVYYIFARYKDGEPANPFWE